MRIMCLSDMHLHRKEHEKNEYYKSLIKESNVDVVVFAGDNVESTLNKYAYEILANIAGDKKAIFCLGNHEFAYRRIDEVLYIYKENYDPTKYDVHCLDVLGCEDIDNIRFLGNVLWFDGSLKTVPNQSDIIDDSWLDSTIRFFDWKKENTKCVNAIKKNCDDRFLNVLVTHCVPHIKLNLHTEMNSNIYNMYSGMNLLDDMKFDYSISGHTHFRTIGQVINDCQCINTGGEGKYYILEI